MSTLTARYLRLLLTRGDRDDWRPPVLSVRARHLAEVLSSYANDEGRAFPAVDVLAERMGITAANVRRARAELVEAGVIAVSEGGGQHRTNTYRFPVTNPLGVVPNPRATARVTPSTTRAPVRANPRATARPKNHEEPRIANTYAVPRADDPRPWLTEGLSYRLWLKRNPNDPRALGNGRTRAR